MKHTMHQHKQCKCGETLYMEHRTDLNQNESDIVHISIHCQKCMRKNTFKFLHRYKKPMKTEQKKADNFTELKNINKGKCFVLYVGSDDPYMIISDKNIIYLNDGGLFAVSLKTGEINKFDSDLKVIPISGVFIWGPK